MQDFIEILADATIDSLKILPFLLALYIVIEIFEYNARLKHGFTNLLSKRAAPLMGATVGLLPQCGFSVVATNLYSRKNISIGALFAVYIATSDEAIPILLASPSAWQKLLPLLIIKFIFAVSAGYAINFAVKRLKKLSISKHFEASTPKSGECDCDHTDDNYECQCHCHTHTHANSKTANQMRSKLNAFLLHPLWHVAKILFFIFVVNLVFGILIFLVGEDALIGFMNSSKFAQPFLAALIGLIPNCASSVLITQLYIIDALSLGAVVAGLSVNAGVAFAVLVKENKNQKQNLLIISTLFVLSIAVGLIITLVL